jgi:hypothetical protein
VTCGFVFIVNHMNIILGLDGKLLMGYCGCCGKVQSQQLNRTHWRPLQRASSNYARPCTVQVAQ